MCIDYIHTIDNNPIHGIIGVHYHTTPTMHIGVHAQQRFKVMGSFIMAKSVKQELLKGLGLNEKQIAAVLAAQVSTPAEDRTHKYWVYMNPEEAAKLKKIMPDVRMVKYADVRKERKARKEAS